MDTCVPTGLIRSEVGCTWIFHSLSSQARETTNFVSTSQTSREEVGLVFWGKRKMK